MSETPNNPGPNGEQPGSTPPPGPQFNPQTGFPSGDSTPPPPQPGYGQPYPQQPYGQPYQQQPYQQPYGYAPYGSAPPQDHPQATTAMITGLIAVVGGFVCALPLLAAPFAWVLGQRAKKEIDREPGRYGGRAQAMTGMVLGIVGTVLLALAILAIIVIVILVANDPNAFDDY